MECYADADPGADGLLPGVPRDGFDYGFTITTGGQSLDESNVYSIATNQARMSSRYIFRAEPSRAERVS